MHNLNGLFLKVENYKKLKEEKYIVLIFHFHLKIEFIIVIMRQIIIIGYLF